MELKKFETVKGYPTAFASNKEKGSKEYGLQYLKQMYQDWDSSNDYSYSDKKQLFAKARSYAEGNQSVAKYKDLLDVEGDTSYMNIDWTPVSIVPKFVDVICGGMNNQEYEIKATAIDPISEKRRQTRKDHLYYNMMNRDFLNDMSQKSGVDFTPKDYVPESQEDLDLFMRLNYKQEYEIALEQGIKFVLDTNNFEELRQRIIRDLVVVGQAALKTSISESNGIKIKYVNPTNLITSYSTSPDFSNIQHAGEVYRVTIGELKEMAGDQFTEEQYKEIAEKYAKKEDNSYNVGTPNLGQSGLFSDDYDNFSIEILDAEFLCTHNMKYEKKENSYGGYSVNKRKDTYKAPKKSKYKREDISSTYKVVYSGKYIVGSDYIFDYKLMENMMRPNSNLTETKLSYIIYAPNMHKMSFTSMVRRMMPFADQIQLAHLKMQQILAKARPKGAAFEVGSLENVSKGDGGTFTPLELQEIYDQTGNIYYRTLNDEGQPAASVPIQELENGIGRDVMNLVQVYNHNLQMIRDVTGVNEVREGAQPSSEALVGIQKMQLMASNNATRAINDGYLHMTKLLGECVSMRLQDLVKYDKPLKGYVMALGKDVMEAFKVNKDVSNYDFGITLDVAPDEIEQQMIEQNIQISLAQKELRLEDAIIVRQIKNPKLANQMLIIRREKYKKDLEQQASHAAEMNAIQQGKAAEAAQIAKQQESALSAKMAQDNLKLKHQTEMAKMEHEYKLKNIFEESNHKRKMAELKEQNAANLASEKGELDNKKETLEKNAHFQSKMIEQRKGKEDPIEDPDLKVKSKYLS
tara:strand:- start:2240 stop:4651 length:2412 start_codon:yes stop_codon:yes gene_type:complete